MAETRPVPIILVDDDPDEHFLFQADLGDAGLDMDFRAFTRGDDALDFLQTRSADGPVLVLTDLSIPGGDPVDFIRKAVPLLGGGNIGVFSGAKNPDTEVDCRDAGASFYIVKPIELDKIKAAVADFPGMQIIAAGNGKIKLVAR